MGAGLSVAIAIPLAGGIFGSVFTQKSVRTWYPKLKKPSWTPPNWLFGPMWTALYTAMGYASWRVFNKLGSPHATPLTLYAIQLAINFSWSPIFFGAKKLGVALGVISTMDVAAGATALEFYKVDPLSGMLLFPYLVWISYATALNAYIYKHNEGDDSKKE
eukprot:CAMPEP_0197470328 /NCGR_PEP_ID=MMETSP1309-20131121/992_1 /TAXON_ID=464262 /ORGANISM="Genus nov. species nov., Strain RCC998" /LENGTH=160 /DNA_ID=CAMNT_0043007087 /DNA_START=41 /DNA_END=523 /DNA_ORIENTATION=-